MWFCVVGGGSVSESVVLLWLCCGRVRPNNHIITYTYRETKVRTPKKAVTHEDRKMQQIKSAKSMERSEAEPVISTQRTTAPSAGRTTTKSPGFGGGGVGGGGGCEHGCVCMDIVCICHIHPRTYVRNIDKHAARLLADVCRDVPVA